MIDICTQAILNVFTTTKYEFKQYPLLLLKVAIVQKYFS